ncbi:MAG: hypothetical protein OZ921_17095 [Sorangiineae bacterium]|nr:hypothetical protein [Polyangiaceae bacterium]MEB2324233.1 hypothetical protein [Sorangiineae bacterium]
MRRGTSRSARALASLGALGALGAGCTVDIAQPERVERMGVTVALADGTPLPGPGDAPLPIPPDGTVELVVDLRALRADGAVDATFSGFVRLDVEPGTVIRVRGEGAEGRNALLAGGVAEGVRVLLGNVRGPTRVWAEDIGYVPTDPFLPPACADGLDNDGDGLADYPVDPGCAFANDDTETVGNFAAGVSAPVRFALPRLADLQGLGASTPYSQEAVTVMTEDPAVVIVTRVASDGFYATDVTETRGFGHVFAFNFSTPGGVRVCDRVTSLSGTAADFFGFTELSFPSYDVHAWVFPDARGAHDGPCRVPEPWLIDAAGIADATAMESHESGLVRVESVTVGKHFGPELAKNNSFGPTRSNCDFDGSGSIDFTPNSPEGSCVNACGADAECSEWSQYVGRGNFLVRLPTGQPIQLNTGTISGFEPPRARGKALAFVTGTLRNFSGGKLNWTIEPRCPDDLVCDDPSQPACDPERNAPVSSGTACVSRRTTDDPNEATN